MNFKMVFIPKTSEDARFEKEYETQQEAELALEAIAGYTQMLHECSLMSDWSNCGMVFKKNEEGEWIEIDGDGNEL